MGEEKKGEKSEEGGGEGEIPKPQPLISSKSSIGIGPQMSESVAPQIPPFIPRLTTVQSERPREEKMGGGPRDKNLNNWSKTLGGGDGAD